MADDGGWADWEREREGAKRIEQICPVLLDDGMCLYSIESPCKQEAVTIAGL